MVIPLKSIDLQQFTRDLKEIEEARNIEKVSSTLRLLLTCAVGGPSPYSSLQVIWFKVEDLDKEGTPRSEYRFQKLDHLVDKVSQAIATATLKQDPHNTSSRSDAKELVRTLLKPTPSSDKILEGGVDAFKPFLTKIREEGDIASIQEALGYLTDHAVEKTPGAWVIYVTEKFSLGLERLVDKLRDSIATHNPFKKEKEYFVQADTLLMNFQQNYSIKAFTPPPARILAEIDTFKAITAKIQAQADISPIKEALDLLSEHAVQKNANFWVIYITPNLYIRLKRFVDEMEEAIDTHEECTDEHYYAQIEELAKAFKIKYLLF
jgi:hypothetical protein